MASVHHLYGLGFNIPHHIIQTASCIEEKYKEHHYAAVKIQSLWRGYVVRKMIRNWNKAATHIQRIIKGWLIRWHLLEAYEEYYKRLQEINYNLQATKIQALWRGYHLRKTLHIIEDIRKEAKLQSINLSMANKLKELITNTKSKEREQSEAEKAVLFTLFKTHHFLRTYVEEGVASSHGTKELSRIEKLMKSIRMKNYMKDLRKIYNKQYKTSVEPNENKFANKKLRELYKLYCNKDKTFDLKEKKIKFDEDIHEKSFILDRKPITYKYESPMLYEEKYTGIKRNLLERTIDNSKMISDNDFDLYVYKCGKYVPKVPPYYIDYWEKKKCAQYCLDYLFN